MLAVAPVVVAGATLASVGCGGVLGGAALDTKLIDALAPVSCAIQFAAAEDSNYTAAFGNRQSGFKFTGLPADDLSKPARRIAIMSARRDEVAAAERALAGLTATDKVGASLVEAAKLDLADARSTIAYELKWAPGDPKAPEAPVFIPRLGELVALQTADVKTKLNACTVPADLARRTKAYNS